MLKLTAAFVLIAAGIPWTAQAAKSFSKEQMAYHLGKNLGLAAIGHGQNAPKTAVDGVFRKAEIIGRAPGAAVPPLPAKTGVKAKDSAAALGYLLRGAGKPLLALIKVKHGVKAAALFDMAVKVCILALIYTPGDSLGASAAVGIERAAIKGGVPATIWGPLITKVRAKSPYPVVKAAAFDLHRAMERHLGG